MSSPKHTTLESHIQTTDDFPFSDTDEIVFKTLNALEGPVENQYRIRAVHYFDHCVSGSYALDLLRRILKYYGTDGLPVDFSGWDSDNVWTPHDVDIFFRVNLPDNCFFEAVRQIKQYWGSDVKVTSTSTRVTNLEIKGAAIQLVRPFLEGSKPLPNTHLHLFDATHFSVGKVALVPRQPPCCFHKDDIKIVDIGPYVLVCRREMLEDFGKNQLHYYRDDDHPRYKACIEAVHKYTERGFTAIHQPRTLVDLFGEYRPAVKE